MMFYVSIVISAKARATSRPRKYITQPKCVSIVKLQI